MFSFFRSCAKNNDSDKEAINEIYQQIIKVLKVLEHVKFPDGDGDNPWTLNYHTYTELLTLSNFLLMLSPKNLMPSERCPIEDVFYNYKLLIDSVQIIDRKRKEMANRLLRTDYVSQHNLHTCLRISLSKFDGQHALLKPHLTILKNLIVEYFQLILSKSYGLLSSSVVSQLLFPSKDLDSNKLSLEKICILKLREKLNFEQLHKETLRKKLHISPIHPRVSY